MASATVISSPPPSPAGSLGGSSSTCGALAPRSASGSGTSPSNTGPVTGSVVGGVVSAALVSMAVFLILQRHRPQPEGVKGVSIEYVKIYQLSDSSKPCKQRYQLAGGPEAAEVPCGKPAGYEGGRAELA